MKQYHVYGLGNALVDIEYKVDAQALRELGVDKGVMTLVDEAQQSRIIAGLKGGESNRGSGGSAANTVTAVSQFGGKSFYSCKVANDEMGHFYVDDLIRGGVTTNIHPAQTRSGATGKCLVFVTPDADRTMNTFLGVSAEFSPAEVDPSAIEESEYVYIEGYLVTGEPTRAAAIHACELARQKNTLIAFTLSDPNMPRFFRDGILQIIGGGVDLLFANEEEAFELAGTRDLKAAIANLKVLARELVITRGPQGALIYDGREPIEIAPVKTKAVDTTGAGDLFAGAYLYGITHGLSRRRAGDLASLAASRLVAQPGPRLRAEQISAILQEFKNSGSK
ncbi:MAG TPA: adenosine kinase [Gammaproteobacteria bacterium]|nr:adenosine kinase [Gammaproteobacteria bacterium]